VATENLRIPKFSSKEEEEAYWEEQFGETTTGFVKIPKKVKKPQKGEKEND
jgi:hypothetical protein